jgi:hypothetical protein
MTAVEDYMPGDPAVRVLGKPEEKPARVHKPLPRKRRVVNAHTIMYDVQLRLDQLRPAAEEAKRLERVLKLWEKL